MDANRPKAALPTVVTRILISESGDIIVTDLWEEAAELLKESFEMEGSTCEID